MNKILIFTTAYWPFIGGAEIAVKEITDRLGGNNSQSYSFDLITSRLDKKLAPKERVGNINVFRLGGGRKFDKFLLPFNGLFLALKLNRLNEYDWAMSVMASQAGITAALFKILKPKVKLLLNLQEGDEEEYLARYVFGSNFLFKLLIRPLSRLVVKKADYITVISRYLQERAKNGGARCPIEVIPNGVDVGKFKVSARGGSAFGGKSSYLKVIEFKKSLGLSENEKVIITVSRLVKKNGVEDLIRAFSYLNDIDCYLFIIGTGELQTELKKLTAELKLEKRIIFLGKIAHDQVPSYLTASDVFVRSSLSEGLGNAFLEAMATGVPVVGTPIGGIPDFLFDEETGLLCQAGNPADIAAKIRRLLDDTVLAEKIKANGLKLVQEKYDWSKIAASYDGVFEKIVK